jgi:hypothetical protein
MPETSISQPGSTEWLRAEVARTPDRARQARLLCELGELAERAGDEPTAARDYLAAFNADAAFHAKVERYINMFCDVLTS